MAAASRSGLVVGWATRAMPRPCHTASASRGMPESRRGRDCSRPSCIRAPPAALYHPRAAGWFPPPQATPRQIRYHRSHTGGGGAGEAVTAVRADSEAEVVRLVGAGDAGALVTHVVQHPARTHLARTRRARCSPRRHTRDRTRPAPASNASRRAHPPSPTHSLRFSLSLSLSLSLPAAPSPPPPSPPSPLPLPPWPPRATAHARRAAMCSAHDSPWAGGRAVMRGGCRGWGCEVGWGGVCVCGLRWRVARAPWRLSGPARWRRSTP